MRTRRTVLSGLSALAVAVSVASAQTPYKTRHDIVTYGATGIGSPYVWGGGNWDPNNRTWGGADCSGFVSKSWSISRWTPYRVTLHGPSTAGYIVTPGSDWYEVNRSDMLYGDALCYRYNENTSGHIYLFLSGDGWGEHEVYEARGTAYGIVHRWRTAYSGADQTKGLRRTQLIENINVTEHVVESDDGTPYYTDVGMTDSSQWDSYAPACQEGDCRYHWVTTDRSQTCTFLPNIPEAGWYRVYVTCNEDDPNVHDVGVTVNHAYGADRYLWDQADAASLNTWVPVGDQSFYLSAGMSGTVVWDDSEAWPTDGNSVFRGDATKFSLDNRVEVDGVGGTPGKFATIRDALAWISTHESEEPDVINVTTDLVIESACIELDLWDDVTINGDADDNGVPVTIAVSPSVPSDWSSSCGMYLDIPIQHEYTIRDVTLIPAWVSSGHSTGAYGLVIDEQNPADDACGWSLVLENVTISAHVPDYIPSLPTSDSRSYATMFGSTTSNYGAAVLQRGSDWAGDAVCRQTVTATNLTITHSATRGLALLSAYTDWVIDGGLHVSYNGQEGIKAYQLGGSTLTIQRSAGLAANRIENNDGRGIVHADSSPSANVDVGQCIIQGNNSGGVYASNAGLTIRDSWIVDNVASGSGGGVYASGGTASIQQCTVANNSAASAGGIYSSGTTGTVSNSIVWGNDAAQISSALAVSYSDVEGGYTGSGNVDVDPALVDSGAGDYHIQRWSPCINTGDPSFAPVGGETDIDGEPCVQAGFVEMGADETPFWAGDADYDGDVELDDFAALADCLAGPGVTPPSGGHDCLGVFDFDDDGDVDLADFSRFRLREAGMPVNPVADIIIESRDAAGDVTPPPDYVEDGAWLNSTIKSTVPGLTGTGSRYINYDLPNAGTDNATFVPDIVTEGIYEIFVTWDIGANCYDAQYTIQHADGSAVLLVDQIPDGVEGANANTWVSLGQYRFEPGQSAATGSVNVSEETVVGDPDKPHPTWNQRVYADAAKWAYIAP